MDSRKIGVFDSGVGGLTVLEKLHDLLPGEDIVYLGDTKRIPYGPRSKEEIVEFSLEIVDYLEKKDVKLIVVACNTITANALKEIKSYTDLPVIGVIDPGIRGGIKASRNKKIGLLATEATIRSGVYEEGLKALDKDIEVKGVASGEMVSIVEYGFEYYGEEASIKHIEAALEKFKGFSMDSLILGCTHFPVLEGNIREYLEGVDLIDPAYETSLEVKNRLEDLGLVNKSRSKSKVDYLVTGDRAKFIEVARNILKEDIDAQVVDVTRS